MSESHEDIRLSIKMWFESLNDRLDRDLGVVTERLGGLSESVSSARERIVSVETSIKSVDARLGGLDDDTKTIRSRVTSLERTQSEAEGTIRGIRWFVATTAAVILFWKQAGEWLKMLFRHNG